MPLLPDWETQKGRDHVSHRLVPTLSTLTNSQHLLNKYLLSTDTDQLNEEWPYSISCSSHTATVGIQNNHRVFALRRSHMLIIRKYGLETADTTQYSVLKAVFILSNY